MQRKLGFMASLGYAQMDPNRACESLASLGYEGVEWTLAHFNPRTKSKPQLKDLVQITGRHGLEISEVVVQQDVVCLDENVRQDRIRLVLECIEAAGYRGFMSVEFESFAYYQRILNNDVEAAAKISMSQIKGLFHG